MLYSCSFILVVYRNQNSVANQFLPFFFFFFAKTCTVFNTATLKAFGNLNPELGLWFRFKDEFSSCHDTKKQSKNLTDITLRKENSSYRKLTPFVLSSYGKENWMAVGPPKLLGTRSVLQNRKEVWGLKNWVSWNTVSAIKLIWLLFFKQDSIWATWYLTEVLECLSTLFLYVT